MMPLTQYLKEGYEWGKSPAWHRTEERHARGLPPAPLEAELDDWEKELAWTEILVLSGNADECFTHLARAWGRDDGFHVILSQFVGDGNGSNIRASSSSKKARGNRSSQQQQQEQEHQMQVQHYQRHHQRHPTMEAITSWMEGHGEDALAAESFDFSGEFLFQDLEEDIDSLGSGDDENNDDEAQVCQPCANQEAV